MDVMGAREGSSAAKRSEPMEANPPSYEYWLTFVKAYYSGAVTPPYYGSDISSPTPNPYIWGSQPAMMPPYGTPIPYASLYPPARVYAHPGMPMQDERELQRQKRKQAAQKLRMRKQTPSTAQPVVEMKPKAHHGEKKGQKKKYKGTLGNENVFFGNGEVGKVASSSGNHGTSTQSVESEQYVSSDANHLSAMAGNLNMWIDLWNPAPGNVDVEMQQNSCDVSQQTISSPIMGRDCMIPDQCTQKDEWGLKTQKRKQYNREAAEKLRLRKQKDERELKRQKRKQSNREAVQKLIVQQDERELKRQKRKRSNREAAHKARLRKQAECDELITRVQVLSNENGNLKDELQMLADKCKQLTSENNSMKDKLNKPCEPDAVLKLDGHIQSQADDKGRD